MVLSDLLIGALRNEFPGDAKIEELIQNGDGFALQMRLATYPDEALRQMIQVEVEASLQE